MIDPLSQLAITMVANPGTTALLLGSGISRSADIPSGWEVVLDLISRVAIVSGEQTPLDAEAWYLDKFGTPPSYSELLGMLGKTPTERANLLKSYFEPTSEEREKGMKQPTDAHRAIAELVAIGHVKVIVTTNFDRLTEQALTEAGISYQTISSADATEGMTPLAHATCTIIKLHGDYGDMRIKNTPEELSSYDDRLNWLLDRILDEYGLIIAGWSADYDTALSASFNRCKSRRYTTYWLSLGELSAAAETICTVRSAQILQIAGADVFFPELLDKVRFVASQKSSALLSPSQIIAQIRRYLFDQKFTIRLHELLATESERAVKQLESLNFKHDLSAPGQQILDRVERYSAALESLLAALVQGAYWEKNDFQLWTKIFNRLPEPESRGGLVALIHLERFPGFLLYNAVGIAAVAGSNWGFWAEVANHTRVRINGKRVSPATAYQVHEVFQDNAQSALPIQGKADDRVSQYLREKLKPLLQGILPTDREVDQAFDRFEYLNGILGVVWSGDNSFLPSGLFMYRRSESFEPPELIEEIQTEFGMTGAKWGPIAHGLFPSAQEFQAAKRKYDEIVKRLCFRRL